jgi:hypothetical protein
MNPFHKPHRLNIRAAISMLLRNDFNPTTPSFSNPGTLWMVRQAAYAYPCSVGNFAVGLLSDTLRFSISFSPVLVCIRQEVGCPRLVIGHNMVLNDPTLYEVSILKYVLFP